MKSDDENRSVGCSALRGILSTFSLPETCSAFCLPPEQKVLHLMLDAAVWVRSNQGGAGCAPGIDRFKQLVSQLLAQSTVTAFDHVVWG